MKEFASTWEVCYHSLLVRILYAEKDTRGDDERGEWMRNCNMLRVDGDACYSRSISRGLMYEIFLLNTCLSIAVTTPGTAQSSATPVIWFMNYIFSKVPRYTTVLYAYEA